MRYQEIIERDEPIAEDAPVAPNAMTPGQWDKRQDRNRRKQEKMRTILSKQAQDNAAAAQKVSDLRSSLNEEHDPKPRAFFEAYASEITRNAATIARLFRMFSE